MSTLATADLSSDSENDGDFIPDLPKSKTQSKRKSKSKDDKTKKVKRTKLNTDEESDSATSSSSSSGEDGDDDQGTSELAQQNKSDEIEERKRKAREEFERMKAELSGTASSHQKEEKEKEVGMVEIRRARRFAGETIYETVKLKSDDPEAIAYLSKMNNDRDQGDTSKEFGSVGESSTSTSTNTPMSTNKAKNDNSITIPTENGSSNSAPIPAIPNPANPSIPLTTSTIAPPRPKGPPVRRKPRQSLESMSAALDKGKKMTTLEKSQMDWKSHTTSTQGLQDELSLNRKNGGGYLDKKDFLDRVGERRLNDLDSRK